MFLTLLFSFSSFEISSVLFRCCCRTWDALPSTLLRVQSASCFSRTDSTAPSPAAVLLCASVPSHSRSCAMKRLFLPSRLGRLWKILLTVNTTTYTCVMRLLDLKTTLPATRVSLRRGETSRTTNMFHVKNYLRSFCITIAHLDLSLEKCNHLMGTEFIFLMLEMNRSQ